LSLNAKHPNTVDAMIVYLLELWWKFFSEYFI